MGSFKEKGTCIVYHTIPIFPKKAQITVSAGFLYILLGKENVRIDVLGFSCPLKN